MRVGVVRGVDLAPLGAAAVAVAMSVVYVRVVAGQGDRPLAWVLLALGVGAACGAYGVPVSAPHRRPVLLLGGCLLGLLGLLAILTIGLPILVAGALLLLGAVRPGVPGAPA